MDVSGADGFLDVKKLIESMTPQEHILCADAYFGSIANDAPQLRKPFDSPTETPNVLRDLSIVLHGLKLFYGARVVDFGAGTCWLSKAFAYLGCDTIALDVSRAALALGRNWIE